MLVLRAKFGGEGGADTALQRFVPERVFLNLPRVTRIVCSITVSFGAGFSFSFAEDDGGASSVSTASSSVDLGWLETSDAAAFSFWVFEEAVAGTAVSSTFEGPAATSATSMWF